MYEHIVYEVNDPVGVITLDRPERLNAFTNRTLTELRDAVERAGADPSVVGTVITGHGRGFCAGLDVEALASTARSGSSSRPEPDPDELPGLFGYFLLQDKPIVAAVNGVVAGGGLELTWASLDRPDLAEGVAAMVERLPPRFARLGGDPAAPAHMGERR